MYNMNVGSMRARGLVRCHASSYRGCSNDDDDDDGGGVEVLK